MTFQALLAMIFEAAAFCFALAAIVWLAWALVGTAGDVRRRRLRIALSSVILCAAAFLSGVALIFLVLWPQAAMRSSTADFQPPYMWGSRILSFVGFSGIIVSAGLVLSALWRRQENKKGRLMGALASAVLVVAAMGADYALIYKVQMLAHARYVHIESGDWKTRVGEQAPDFTVTMLDGSKSRLSDLRDKVVLVNFFATWCSPCQFELPHLQKLWSDLENRDRFAMLVVSRDEPQETVETFVANHGFTFHVALDEGGKVFYEFAKESIPRTYLIGSDGAILFQSRGFSDDMPVYQRELETLRQIIERELSNHAEWSMLRCVVVSVCFPG